MAEVSRLSALDASLMKVDFISSISHELRSPLHGILASVELIQDEGNMSDMQADLVNTIVCDLSHKANNLLLLVRLHQRILILR